MDEMQQESKVDVTELIHLIGEQHIRIYQLNRDLVRLQQEYNSVVKQLNEVSYQLKITRKLELVDSNMG